MSQAKTYRPDPDCDLTFARIIDVPRELIWQAWTTPKLITQWFTPAPWKTIACDIDLQPGGNFYTLMLSPEGQELPNVGCFLEIIENEKLVWTNTLSEGFRPTTRDANGFYFTATITLEPHPQGTKYTATVIHNDQQACQTHNALGFHEGWGLALDQLIAMIKKM